eukprot:10798689-Heterocapsa_arctica.AAC.1
MSIHNLHGQSWHSRPHTSLLRRSGGCMRQRICRLRPGVVNASEDAGKTRHIIGKKMQKDLL